MRKLIAIGLVCFIAAVATMGSLRPTPNQATVSPSQQTLSTATKTAAGVGYVEPMSELRRLSPRTGGVVASIRVAAGANVKTGEVLAELDSSGPLSAVAVEQAKLIVARSELFEVERGVNPLRIQVAERTLDILLEKERYAKIEFNRLTHVEGARSDSERDAADTVLRQASAKVLEGKAELDHLRHFATPEAKTVAAAKVKLAEAAVREAEQKVEDTKIVAPCDGTVLRLLKREGDGVSALQPDAVLLFANLSNLRVRAELDESYAHAVSVGQPATVGGVNLGGRKVAGRVAVVEMIVGRKTLFTDAANERRDISVFEVVIALDESLQLPLGTKLDVWITTNP